MNLWKTTPVLLTRDPYNGEERNEALNKNILSSCDLKTTKLSLYRYTVKYILEVLYLDLLESGLASSILVTPSLNIAVNPV